MELKKMQWKSEKQKKRITALVILGIVFLLFLISMTVIHVNQHDQTRFLWEEWFTQIGDLHHEDVSEHYAALGYQCITNKTRYSLEESCDHISGDEVYPQVRFTSNKKSEVLFIDISNSESILFRSDEALEKFTEMSSIALIFAESNQSDLSDWISKTLPEQHVREFTCILRTPYQLEFYEGNVVLHIGAHDIICSSVY